MFSCQTQVRGEVSLARGTSGRTAELGWVRVPLWHPLSEASGWALRWRGGHPAAEGAGACPPQAVPSSRLGSDAAKAPAGMGPGCTPALGAAWVALGTVTGGTGVSASPPDPRPLRFPIHLGPGGLGKVGGEGDARGGMLQVRQPGALGAGLCPPRGLTGQSGFRSPHQRRGVRFDPPVPLSPPPIRFCAL